MNKLMRVILAVILVTLCFQKANSAVLLDKIVATVNEEVITWSELMHMVMAEGKPYFENSTEEAKQEKIQELSRPFLNNLIELRLQVQEARNLGLSVSNTELDSAIAEIKNKFGLSDEAFVESLKSEKMTMKDYRTRLAEQILIQKIINVAVKSKIVISDDDIAKYYQDHRSRFSEEDELKIRQIFFPISDESESRVEIEEKAEKIYQKLIKGEDFAALAKEFSEGPNRDEGGDLGYISRGSALEEIETVAASLAIGQVSQPFWSSAGMHIIKLEDRKEGRDVHSVREKIKESLVEKAFEVNYHEWMSGLREKANIEIRL